MPIPGRLRVRNVGQLTTLMTQISLFGQLLSKGQGDAPSLKRVEDSLFIRYSIFMLTIAHNVPILQTRPQETFI